MRNPFKKRDIDAGEEIARMQGEVAEAQLGGSRRPRIAGVRTVMIVGLVLVGLSVVFITWKANQVSASLATAPKVDVIASAKPLDVPPPKQEMPEEKAPPAEAPGWIEQKMQQMAPPPPESDGKPKVSRSDRQSSAPEWLGETASSPAQNGAQMVAGDDEWSARLRSSRMDTSIARMGGDRRWTINEGRALPCVLDTMLITSQPGKIRCHLASDAWSEDKSVVLMEERTQINGVYTVALARGKTAIFVLATTANTPKGVKIDLDSPVTGALGDAGLSGYVDDHFWERFKGAIMIGFIADLGQTLVGSQRNSSGQSVSIGGTTGGAQSAATEAIKESANIDSTLYKLPGEVITIMVARDIDFSTVYALRPR